jgi:hypothetical protein
MQFRLLLTLILLASPMILARAATNGPLAIRGYYTTFMRMPTFGLPEWKQMIDCMKEDDADMLILWTAGGFRSKQFPVTWKYNADHKNVERDYVRELIGYAQGKGIRVLLGFTPFAYDGVNQYPLEHPELKATQKNGEPAQFWGLHSWGYNLCPAQPASQKFMRDYVREMFFDFYPNADGLLIESSDYAICYCAQCREKFFEYEFAFVRQISDDVWGAKSNAVIMVYPHYFSSRKVPGFDVAGATQRFDPRWTLFFTLHSAHINEELIRQSQTSVFSNEGISIGSLTKVRDGARMAQRHGLSGYIASCEPFSCIDGPPGSNKRRQKPFHFEWLREGQMPLRELPARVSRIAFREYTRDPSLSDSALEGAVGKELLGDTAKKESIDDLLFVRGCWFNEAEWFAPALLLRPDELRQRAAREKWPAERLRDYMARIERLRGIAGRYARSSNANEREMARIAGLIAGKWDAVTHGGAGGLR